MKRIAIFASGSGTNFEALVNETYKNGEIVLLICDKPNAYVIERAKNHNINYFIVELKKFENKEAYETAIVNKLKEEKIDLVLLAGYMKIVDKVLLDAYEGRIINIHPALLPSFKGAHGIKDAYEYGVKIMGVTIHYVNKEVDGGKIIAQDCFHLNGETLEEAEEKIHAIEHKLFPATLKKLLEEK
jgi:phosphoribosylglycinamide formyltransferase-1